MRRGFVHLHVHTEYSLVDGLVRVPRLVRRVMELNQPAVAVTDQGNVFAAVKFYQAALRVGVKPIIGAELWIGTEHASSARSKVVLLCKNGTGYHNLSQLITRSFREGQIRGIPGLSYEWLSQKSMDGLIVLSGGLHGEIAVASTDGADRRAADRARFWADLCGDSFYLEIARTGRLGEERANQGSLDLAARLALPVVATNDVRFLFADEFEAHEARVCIQQGRTLSDPRRQRSYTADQYLRDAEAMDELFADIPQAIDNAWYIAQRCNLELQIGSYHLPEYPVDSNDSVDSVLRDAATRGLKDRFVSSQDDAEVTEPVVDQRYLERLNDEIEVITKMGFAGYFMIVADFIRWAKAQKIPVGPGRGSGAGSLTAYALGITELDPLAYDLLFERFLNPERVSMPDFDVDFCMERRDEVIDYVIDRYGSERVAQIITHGTMAAKAVVRDVGRVLGFPYGFVDQIAKLIPFDPHMTLDRALDEEPVLKERYAQEDDLRSIIDLAKKLEGLTRNAGRHAGGVVIAPCDLTVFMPIYCEQGTATNVTQFDMTDIETIGLVKFDFLGLRTLTIIDWTVRQIHASAGDDSFDIGAIALNDAATFKLIQEAKTTAVFQLESRGMKELIKQLRPDSFEDLIALVALFRPGPLQSGMVDDFIDRKHGRALVKYPHPALEPILHTTYGVILYQEQVMQIARVLAGYTLGAADLLRRAMGKKKAEEMAEQRETFMSGTRRNDVDPKIAGQIFDLMEKFAGYGFNKSHSAAYALVAYQTAWLKTHYPAAFMAAVLSADMDSTDKVVRLIEECRSLGLTVDRPNVNTSAYRFTVADDQTIRYGLGAVKGVGESVINSICSERDRGGPYQNVFDLCRRNETRKLSKRVLEALIKAGPLDEFSASRKGLMSVAERALQIADQDAKAAAAGQEDLFGLDCGSAESESVTDAEWRAAVAMEEWANEELLAWEKETLGLYLSGHPIDRYLPELEGIANCRLINLTPGRRRVFGLIVGVRMIKGRRGRMAVVTLDDKSARIEVTVYSDVLEKCIDLLVVDRFCVIEGDCIVDDYSGGHSIIAETVLGIDEARNQLAKSLTLILGTTAPNGLIAELKESLAKYRDGSCPVEIEYENATATARLRLADDWSVTLSDNLLEGLQAKFCSEAVRVKY